MLYKKVKFLDEKALGPMRVALFATEAEDAELQEYWDRFIYRSLPAE